MLTESYNPVRMSIKMTAAMIAAAKRGDKIYRERYKAEYEKSKPGMFVAIDIDGGQAFLADTPEDAIQVALGSLPEGRFHLIKVGASGVFRVAYSRTNANLGGRVLRRRRRE